tara:strand:- start:3323 stop:4162 length:840 start_codon:yes stop_codon:yes gene_type:complete
MILISTSRGIYNLSSKKFIYEDNGVCFGMAKVKKPRKKLFIAVRINDNKGWSHDTKICEFDRSLNLQNEFVISGCEDVHGIEVFDKSLFCLSTKTNKIFETNFQGEILCVHEGIPNCGGAHMNTIKKYGDRLFILCHRDSFDSESCLYSFNTKTKEMIPVSRFLGDHSHSILNFNGRFWICDSLNGRVFSINQNDHVKDAKTSPQLRTIDHINSKADHLLRGLEVDKKYLYIGASAKASTAERHEGCDGGIVKLDKSDGKILKEITISECGQVNEILCY